MLAKIFRVNLDKRIDELGIDVDELNKKDILDLNSPKGGQKEIDLIERKKKNIQPPGYLFNTRTSAHKIVNCPNRS